MKNPGSPIYTFLDDEFNRLAGGQAGHDSLVATSPLQLDSETVDAFASRYNTIRRFQQITLELFTASLKGDAEPWIADLILSDVPDSFAREYHANLEESQMQLPVFFRTDEPAPGILSEIQCPGSGWANHSLLYSLYKHFPEQFGKPCFAKRSLSEQLADDLRDLLGEDPEIYYLLDNASLPHGARYFIEKTRQHGVRYYSWDPDLHPRSCNFVRAHDWISLLNNNFHQSHQQSCAAGKLKYDLSPMALFEAKVIMALPFDSRTSAHYDDEIRSIFPYTALLQSEQLTCPDGETVSIDAVCEDAQRRRLYLKYAGTDVNFNWGSRAVYHLGKNSRIQSRKQFDMALADVRQGRPWIIQQPYRTKDVTTYISKEGTLEESRGYLKISGFYGPSGLLGILCYHLRSAKVHGNSQTIMSIAY